MLDLEGVQIVRTGNIEINVIIVLNNDVKMINHLLPFCIYIWARI